MKRIDVHDRFDFLVGEIARLYTRRYDRSARDALGLTHAQVRLLCTLAVPGAEAGLTQHALAEELEMTQVGIARMCARLEAAGWIQRLDSASDRRVWIVTLKPCAHEALDKAIDLADAQQDAVLGGLSASDRGRLVGLLRSVHATLIA